MADGRDRVVVEAHALRTATAKAALLHGSRRGPRELRRPYAAILASLVVGALLLVVVWAITTIGALLAEQRRQRALEPGVPHVAAVWAPGGSGWDQPQAHPVTRSKPPKTAITSGTRLTTATISTRSSS
jgi:hypothetical protein